MNCYGHVGIGDQDRVGVVVRALDYGGSVCESDKLKSFVEAMAALEKALTEYFEQQGIEK